MSDTPSIDHHHDLDYVETEFSLQTTFTAAKSPEGIEVSGTCPGCGGWTTITLERGSPQGFKGLFRTRNVGAQPRVVTIFCVCGHMHAGRPADAVDNGCGAFWSVELP
jgi:hypothetical protein